VAVTVIAVMAVAATVVAAQGISWFQVREEPAGTTAEVTVTVKTDTLVDSVRGDVRLVPQVVVPVRASGVVTRTGLRQYESVLAGALLGVVNERPIFFLPGDVPAYRDLGPGAVGPDVAQLIAALANLGYLDHAIGDEWGKTLGPALWQFYADRGFSPMDDTGNLAVNAKTHRVVLPLSEFVFAPAVNARTVQPCGQSFQLVADQLCELEAGQHTVTVTVTASEGPLIRAGQSLTMQFGDDLVTGTIMSSLPTSSSSNTSPLNIVASDPEAIPAAMFVASLDSDLPARVATTGTAVITVATSPSDSLVVDAVAIREDADGTDWVLTRSGGHIAVKVGLCVKGSCAVMGEGLASGVELVVPAP
jgi:hypothetical protein